MSTIIAKKINSINCVSWFPLTATIIYRKNCTL